MIKHLFLIFTLIISSTQLHAQLGILENNYVNKLKENEEVSLIVKGDIERIQQVCDDLKANLKYAYKNLAAVSIQKNKLEDFYAKMGDSKIEIPMGKGQLLMDTALIHNNITQIHSGITPLSQAYTGKNVIIGILDSGIYFEHDDFKNANGTTRIKYIWDQNINNPTNPPAPYNYGNEWSWIDIDNGSCNHVEPTSQNGHGTTVAGTAASNGLANGSHKGVAPESDIIAVAVDYYGNDFLSNTLDAIDYVFKKADALGKACVINTSIGTYSGSHDGLDFTTQLIDALLDERPGRVLVSSAGNGNNINNVTNNFNPAHLSYTLSADTNFTWFKVIPSANQVYFDLWADTSDFNNAFFSIGTDSANNFSSIGATDFYSIADFNGNLQQGVLLNDFIFDINSNNQGTLEMFLEESEGRYHLEVLITPLNTQNLWRFSTTGSGTFDIWSSQTFHGTSNMVYDNLPPNFVLPEIDFYKLPDNKKSIVSGWNCSDKVISVGNFSNRATLYDADSIFRTTGLTPGEIYKTSSEGPTRDNRLKPDISATGNVTFATGNLTIINIALNAPSANRSKISPDRLHYSNGGTSIAAPIVAGAAALYLEQNPNAWWYEVKEAITQTALKDNFTGPTENTQYGFGKLNGFAMMQFNAVLGCVDDTMFNYNPNANVDDGSCTPVVLGCTDSTSFNFNPNANTDDGSCIAKVFGCTDTTAFNYNSTANTNDGSCIPFILGCTDSLASNFNPNANTNDGSCVTVGLKDVLKKTFSITPNPASNYVTIKSNITIKDDYSISIMNILGKEIYQNKLFVEQQIDLRNYSKGIYLVNIKQAGSIINSQKLIIK